MKTNITHSALVELYIGGCAGSNISPAERIVRPDEDMNVLVGRPITRQVFGVHTTSLALLIGKTGLIIDNGSGVGQAAEFLKMRGVTALYILQTHYHLDHVSGVVVNPYFLDKSGIVRGIYGPILSTVNMQTVLDQLFAPHFWPMSPKLIGVTNPVHSFAPGETIPIMGGIRTLLLNHAGGSVAYRIPTPVGDIVIATDNELSNELTQRSLANFINGAKLAYIDVQYRDREYDGTAAVGQGRTFLIRKNWGHSTPSMLRQTYELTTVAPELTLIGHHDPKRNDDDLFVFEAEVKRAIGHLCQNISFAQECQLIQFERNSPPRMDEVKTTLISHSSD